MSSELYGSKYVKILIISHPLHFYRSMSISTRKTSITLYVFLHGFDKRCKKYDKVFLSYSLPFTFLLPAWMMPCVAQLSTTYFRCSAAAEIGSMTAYASTRLRAVTAEEARMLHVMSLFLTLAVLLT